MSLIKICGLSTQDTLDAALDAGADMVGFVFFEKSPRDISIPLAGALGRMVGKRAQKARTEADEWLERARSAIKRNDDGGHSFVYKQPESPDEEALCKEAMEGCPVEAIGSDGNGA